MTRLTDEGHMNVGTPVVLRTSHPLYKEYTALVGTIIFRMDGGRVVVKINLTEMWCYLHEIKEKSYE